MSVYRLNKILYLAETDRNFLARFNADAEAAIADIRLTDEERKALLDGDVGKLYLLGVHSFILNTMSRQRLRGVTRDNYLPRLLATLERAKEDAKPPDNKKKQR